MPLIPGGTSTKKEITRVLIFYDKSNFRKEDIHIYKFGTNWIFKNANTKKSLQKILNDEDDDDVEEECDDYINSKNDILKIKLRTNIKKPLNDKEYD